MKDKKIETRVVHRNFGDKQKTKVLKRDFSSAPSKEEISNDVLLMREEVRSGMNYFTKLLNHLFIKGDLEEKQFNAFIQRVKDYEEACNILIDKFESSELISLIEYKNKKNTIEKLILDLRDELDSEIMNERSNVSVK